MQRRTLHAALAFAAALTACSDLGDPYQLRSDCDRSTGGIDFGKVEVGFFAEQTLVIHNSGNADLVGSVDLTDANYAVLSGSGSFTIPPLQDYDVLVRFAPSDTGLHRAQLDLGDGCPPVDLAGSGGYPAGGPRCVVDPLSIDFGEVAPGASIERTFEIRNVGLIDVAVDVASLCVGVFDVLAGDGAGVIEPGDTLRIRVGFSPPAAGDYTCEIATGTTCANVAADGTGKSPVTISYLADVQPIFISRCVVCHDRFGQAGLDLRTNFSYPALVGMVSTGYAPALRVLAGDPTNSVLYGKVAATGQFGDSMPPPGGGPAVPLADREKIRTWILEGALNN
jgi:hypothetical protein